MKTEKQSRKKSYKKIENDFVSEQNVADAYSTPFMFENNQNTSSLDDLFFGVSSEEKLKLKKQLKKEKREKKKNLSKILLSDKFSKNVITARKSIVRQNKIIAKNNQKRVKKCNKYILSHDNSYRDIYLTIDKFNNNGKKTIVYFIDSFYPCIDGVLSVIENYVAYMQNYYNIVVCAPKHKNKCYKVDNYFVLYADSIFIKRQGYDLAFPQLDPVFQKYVSLLKIDLVHLQSPFNMGSFGLALAKKRKIPCFSTFHSQFKKNFYDAVKNEMIATWLTKIVINIFQKSTVAITMNPFARNIMKEYGLKKHVEIIPNATNLVKKEFDREYENAIISKHRIDKNKFNLIFIGRFVAVKNVYFLIDVLADLYKINKDFNFVFLGYGPEEQKMKRKCTELGLDDIVRFTGKIDNEDEKAVIIKNTNLMFFPSCYETDSIVKMEAACYDVPTLCLENTTLSSVITDNQNGFVCKNDKDDCVKRLDFLIKNADFVKKIGKNANLEIYFTWEKPCKQLRALYEKYLNAHHLKHTKKNKN